MDYIDSYVFWNTNAFFDQTTRKELSSLDPEKDKTELEDRL